MLLRHSFLLQANTVFFFVVSLKKVVIYIRYYCSNPSPVTHFGLLAELLSSFETEADDNHNNKHNKNSNNNTIQTIRIKSCELGASKSDAAEDASLLRRYAVSLGQQFSTTTKFVHTVQSLYWRTPFTILTQCTVFN
jgi:hypothetical protein